MPLALGSPSGSIELLALLASRAHLHGAFWDSALAIDINTLGYVIVGLFVITWAAALAIWRFGRIEERWAARIREI